MRTAYDSTTTADIPADAQIVCGYVDGIYRWSGTDWGRFPNALKVGIACFAATNGGQVLDVETGCSAPSEAPGWVRRRRAAGVDPTVYVNRSNWAATRQAFQQQGVPEPHYWLASYDGIAEIPAGCVAKQYANSALSGGHYDLSAVADYWPGVDPYNPNAIAPSEVRVTATIDDVYALLKAVNEVTLLRVEGRVKDINEITLLRMEGEIKELKATVDALKLAPAATPVDLQPVLDAIHNLTLKAS